MFQRRHMNVIAELLKEIDADDDIICHLGVLMAQYNPNFDRDRWFKACGK
tara:strand:- start:1700 stop:1849 length:150 start_codon:yes stop_codon:yes gene_type:complete